MRLPDGYFFSLKKACTAEAFTSWCRRNGVSLAFSKLCGHESHICPGNSSFGAALEPLDTQKESHPEATAGVLWNRCYRCMVAGM